MPKKKTIKKEIKTTRPPVVTIMGHVDHGKTTLLDTIKKSHVTEQEFGGITQHIGAYQVKTKKGIVTFIDTPGHAAFSQMRSRGGQVADIVVLVVAADDGVKPQTIEAIEHAKIADVPIIVAINKNDAEGANLNKVKQGLSDNGILVEDFGGDVIAVDISALKGTNIDKLLDSILAVAELLELENNIEDDLLGTVIESILDKRKGVIATILVQAGTLNIGDKIWAGGQHGKVKVMNNYKGESIRKATPGTPVEILGFKDTPEIGALVVDEVNAEKVEAMLARFEEPEEEYNNDDRILNIILKADTKGTLEAIDQALVATQNEDAKIRVVLRNVGMVNESDVMLANASSAVIFAFNSDNKKVLDFAKQKDVQIRTYNIIYELIADVEKALQGALKKQEDDIKGLLIVKKLFPLPSGDVIAGCEVTIGSIRVGNRIRIWENLVAYKESRKNPNLEPLFYSKIKKIKSGKNDVQKVGRDNDCGVLLSPSFSGLTKEQAIETL